MTPEEESVAIQEVRGRAISEEEGGDFMAELPQISSNNPMFWWEYARALSTLRSSGRLDVRPQGRLEAALVAANRSITLAPELKAAWAEKIVTLFYLAHGLSAMTNVAWGEVPGAGFLQIRAEVAIRLLKQTVDEACRRFPEDEWFREQRTEAYSDFGVVPSGWDSRCEERGNELRGM